jgi:Icc-related predicted phosphoesterase
VRIGCISDIHARPVEIPECDILVIAGDFTYHSSDKELEWFAEFLVEARKKACYIVFVAGNHDKTFQTHPWGSQEYIKRVCADGRTFYLEGTAVTIEGLVFWGSPWTPKGGGAFQFAGPISAREHWAKMPAHVDVLVTHGPPFEILDRTKKGRHVGDQQLLDAVREVKPRLHLFGHIHSGHGMVEIDGTIFVNACICDDDYNAIQSPLVIEIEP